MAAWWEWGLEMDNNMVQTASASGSCACGSGWKCSSKNCVDVARISLMGLGLV